MKSSLPSFAALAIAAVLVAPRAAAQVPAAQPPRARQSAGDSISGEALLRRVVAAVDAQPSITAKVRYRVDLMGRPSEGTGTYVQQGRGPARMLRMELNLQTPGMPNRVRHVCDGTTLWIVEEVARETRVAKVDVARLRAAVPKSQTPPTNDGWLALGGLPRLLVGLDAAFAFGPVRPSRLDDVRVWTLVGNWERGRLGDLLSDQKDAINSGKPADVAKLSPQLPDTVVLHVGCDDFFPYRVEYWRTGHDAPTADSSQGKLLVVMEFYEVHLGAPVDARQFAFQPPADIQPDDRTLQYLDKLGLEEPLPVGARRRGRPWR
jgi:hypothetical protein